MHLRAPFVPRRRTPAIVRRFVLAMLTVVVTLFVVTPAAHAFNVCCAPCHLEEAQGNTLAEATPANATALIIGHLAHAPCLRPSASRAFVATHSVRLRMCVLRV